MAPIFVSLLIRRDQERYAVHLDPVQFRVRCREDPLHQIGHADVPPTT